MRPKFYGTVPTPYEIPPHLLPEEKLPKTPLPITLYAAYRFMWAGISFLLALVPWGRRDLEFGHFLFAHPKVVIFLLPGFLQMLMPPLDTAGVWSRDAFVQVLPFLFLLAAILYAAIAWNLLALSPKWRELAILASGIKVAEMAIGLLFGLADAEHPPMPIATQLTLLLVGSWNLLVF
ncbi:MAG: hypothetical protein ABR924_14235, partial [Terracidiphilus sp.]